MRQLTLPLSTTCASHVAFWGFIVDMDRKFQTITNIPTLQHDHAHQHIIMYIHPVSPTLITYTQCPHTDHVITYTQCYPYTQCPPH